MNAIEQLNLLWQCVGTSIMATFLILVLFLVTSLSVLVLVLVLSSDMEGKANGTCVSVVSKQKSLNFSLLSPLFVGWTNDFYGCTFFLLFFWVSLFSTRRTRMSQHDPLASNRPAHESELSVR